MSELRSETSGDADARTRSTANQAISILQRRRRDGSIAMLAGGALLVRTVRAVRTHKRRSAVLALAASVLVGIGVRQRRASRRAERVPTGADARRDETGDKAVSDAAWAERRDLGAGRDADESASVYQSASEPNPRGVSDRADVQADEGGDVEFVEGKEPETHRETHLEDEDAHDTRLHPDDGRTEVDLSTASMADETSEAAGPHPEQAYPTQEGTDPEPTSEDAPPRVGEGAVAPAGPDDESDENNENEQRDDAEEAESSDETPSESEDDAET